MNDHIRTLLRQAQAFLDARQPLEALRLHEQARVMARDDRAALGQVRFQQALAHDLLGNTNRAIESMREALRLDPALATRAQNLTAAGTCSPALAAELMALAPPPRTYPIERPRRRILVPFLVILLVLGAGAYVVWRVQRTPRVAEQSGSRFDIEHVRAHVGLVVVAAEYTARDGKSLHIPLGMGSCFAVSHDGHMLTNKHVTTVREEAPASFEVGDELIGVHPKWHVRVCLGAKPREQFEARIVYESPYHDLAILKIDHQFNRPFSTARRVQAGDDVFAAGFPGTVNELLTAMSPSDFWQRAAEEFLNGRRDFTTTALSESDYVVTVTRGVVSAIRRIGEVTWVQHDAIISGGSSGGPLLTPDGRVVGMNTLQHAQSEGFNMALPLDQLADELRPFVSLN
jgi:S1-C subfamily serine protease